MRKALLLCLLGGQLAAQNTLLRGRVTDAVSHQPIEGAQIQIGPAAKPLLATTDANGEYRVTRIPPGRTFLEITKNGYAKLGVLSHPAECVFEINSGDRLQRNFELQPGSVIRGRLLDRDTDQPLSGFRVAAMQENYGMGSRRYVPIAMSNPSSTDGEFLIDGLRPGEYVVEVRSSQLPKVTAIAEEKKKKKSYATSYFPGVPRIEMAAPLALGMADNRAIDIRLPSGGVHSISGEVEALKGTGKVNILVEKEDPGSFTLFAKGNLAVPGHFHIDDLSEGNFTILAFTEEKENRQFLEYPIEIGTHDIEDLKLRLIPSLVAKVSIQIAKDSAAMPETKVEFDLPPVKRIRLEGESPFSVTAPGSFERVNTLAGLYFPSLSKLPEGWGVTQIFYQGQTLSYGSAINLDGRSIDPTITFTLSTKLGAASGSIRDTNGNPILGVKVVLLPYPIPELFSPFAFRIATVDSQGSFSFDKIPPGKYKAIALTGNAVKADRDLPALREKATLLDAFEVQAGQIATVSIKP